MKKVLTIVAVAMLICLAIAAQASETDWRFSAKVDNGTGGNAGTASQFGVYSTSSDGYDSAKDVEATYGLDATNASNWIVGIISGDSRVFGKDIKAPGTPKTWQLSVVAGSAAQNTTMRIQFFTLGTAVLPVTSVGGVPVSYTLKMINNRGKEILDGKGNNLIANDTVWNITIPTTHSTTVPFFELAGLPTVKVPSYTAQNMKDYGYAFELTQAPPVPEPSSLLALGTGLSGLAGFVIRRRKA